MHATTRDGVSARQGKGVVTHRLDVRNVEQLTGVIHELPAPISRVIHNAGVFRGDRDEMTEVNTVAPIRTVEALLSSGMIETGGKVALMTSQLGARRGRTSSLGTYGDSKAALNDEFRRRADLWGEAGLIAVVIHPGWVRTDMGGSSAPLSVEESARSITELLDRITRAEQGRFLTWDGRIHPW